MNLNNNKVCIILRGVSGSGKTTVSEYLSYLYSRGIQTENKLCVVCSADEYFVNEHGEYKFDRQKIGHAHNYCKNKFENALNLNTELIIISNTNCSEKEIQPYIDRAREANYSIISLVIENRHGNGNIHGVPADTLIGQEQRLRNSIKLI
jgi:uridine kinase